MSQSSGPADFASVFLRLVGDAAGAATGASMYFFAPPSALRGALGSTTRRVRRSVFVEASAEVAEAAEATEEVCLHPYLLRLAVRGIFGLSEEAAGKLGAQQLLGAAAVARAERADEWVSALEGLAERDEGAQVTRAVRAAKEEEESARTEAQLTDVASSADGEPEGETRETDQAAERADDHGRRGTDPQEPRARGGGRVFPPPS